MLELCIRQYSKAFVPNTPLRVIALSGSRPINCECVGGEVVIEAISCPFNDHDDSLEIIGVTYGERFTQDWKYIGDSYYDEWDEAIYFFYRYTEATVHTGDNS